MPPQNASEIKENIIAFLEHSGPNLPVRIAQNVGQSILFTSAFLSELFSDKRLKISSMRVGNSPVYFLAGQEPQLENFSNFLKSKEKEAYILLKEKQFLKDSEIEPAIRVALREIKDFAVPFRLGDNEEIYWRYFTIDESEFRKSKKSPTEQHERKPSEKKDELNIFDSQEKARKEKRERPSEKSTKKPRAKTSTKKPVTKASKKTSKSESARNRFFNKAKDFLEEKGIEILGIEEIAIDRIIFKVHNKSENSEQEEYLILAYNKKRITEEDIIKAHKKAKELNLRYKILCLGGILKRTENIINASRTLMGIEKIE